MEYTDVKQILKNCADLHGLDEGSLAILLWRGEESSLNTGAIIYAEGTPLDSTFCVLLSGDLVIEKAGTPIGNFSGQRVFGEMAYLTSNKMRTATARVSSPVAVVLKICMTPAELGSPQFSALKKHFGLRTWDRFVSDSQSLP